MAGEELAVADNHVHLMVMIAGAVREFDLPTTGTPYVVGRSPGAHIRLDSTSVSRVHARIIPDAGQVFVQDNGSTNGTFINDERLGRDPVELRVGDSVRFGTVACQLRPNRVSRVAPKVLDPERFDAQLADEGERCLRYERSLAVVSLETSPATREVGAAASAAVLASLRSLDVLTVRGATRIDVLAVETEKSEAVELGRRIAGALRDRAIEARVGVAAFPGDAPHVDGLVVAADQALRNAARGDVGVASAGARSLQLGDREVIVAEPAMVRLDGLIERVACAPIPVLVLGETGCGKEIVAEAIHAMSDRSDRPLIKINCAAVPENLLESELFGHEAGAFSGATAAKPGLLEAAHGGVLFLDEIGEMAPALQAKLLRVLEDGRIRRVGATREQQVDVRIVAATHRDLKAACADGRFRQDLYYRLSGIELSVPPLRERRREIPLLAERFAGDLVERTGATAATFTPQARQALCDYDWPGNIRELKNVVSAAVMTARGDEIGVADLPASVRAVAAVDDAFVDDEPMDGFTETRGAGGPRMRVSLEDKLREVTRRYVLRALEQCGGNQTEAAKLLGISRRTLLYKMQALDIKPATARRRGTRA